MFEPLATVGLGFNSTAVHDVSYESLFVASELGASKPWLFGLAKGSSCKVMDPHVQRVLIGSDGEVKEDTVTLNEEKGHIPSILKNPHRYQIYRRNIRDKLRVEIGVRCQRHKVSNGEAHDGD